MTRSLQPAWFLIVVSMGWACLLTPVLSAQPAEHVTLTGTVVDEETEAPLVGVHVFIATSMIGTITDREGAFRLDKVPLGAHRLVLSMVGFFSETHDLMLRAAPGAPLEFQLQPTVVEVGKVTVTATHNRRWRRDLKKFKRLFVGESPNAKKVEIMNPEVLDFISQKNDFNAIASAPLILENRALGYRIQYFLYHFAATGDYAWQDGDCLFEPLTPEDDAQAARWEKNRQKAFQGSPRHFLRMSRA